MVFSDRNFVGGAPCLDFVNTVGGARTGEPIEHLGSYKDLIEWAFAAGALPDEVCGQLLQMSQADPAAAALALVAAKQFRECLCAALKAGMARHPPSDCDLGEINAVFSRTFGRRRLLSGSSGYTTGWAYDPPDLLAPIWTVAFSAFEFLAADRARELRECASPECGWLFIDNSKNHRRSWCDMRGCGNREKARRFRARAVVG
jgi:predicted RNA-binding Zn ribbon-like protein